MQVAHETLKFFIDFVANLGPKLRTATLLSKLRRVRHGPLVVRDALLLKHCTVPLEIYEQYSSFLTSLAESNEPDPDDIDTLTGVVERTRHLVGPNIFHNLHLCSHSVNVKEQGKLADSHLIQIEK